MQDFIEIFKNKIFLASLINFILGGVVIGSLVVAFTDRPISYIEGVLHIGKLTKEENNFSTFILHTPLIRGLEYDWIRQKASLRSVRIGEYNIDKIETFVRQGVIKDKARVAIGNFIIFVPHDGEHGMHWIIRGDSTDSRFYKVNK